MPFELDSDAVAGRIDRINPCFGIIEVVCSPTAMANTKTIATND
jgi:hypothetical protein